MTEPLSAEREAYIREELEPEPQYAIGADYRDYALELLDELDRIRPLLTEARAWLADPYNPRHIAQVAQSITRRCDEAVAAIAAERDQLKHELAEQEQTLRAQYAAEFQARLAELSPPGLIP